jgi:hexosaminidase
VELFNVQLRKIFVEEGQGPACITLMQTEDFSEEAYRLEILTDAIFLSASEGAGIFRGLQVLRQLILSGCSKGVLSIPCGLIEDKPRFRWRGFMLDCARYFYSTDFIKHLLDALSLQHINIFHWHLTDDQGWRLPVSQYPLLIGVGGKRYDSRADRYISGFYSEAKIRDIVAYAAERHIEVVPEVNFPGHTSAMLEAYPTLGCTGGPYHVEERYGIFEDVLCAGNDEIFTLAEAVFDTLETLFPSKYVHFGGDEVLFKHWAECPKCGKRMVELGIEKPSQLQSWITLRLIEMLRKRGKTAIGWDEILDNTEQFPLPKDIIVMSWRNQDGGSRASSLGCRTIMTPQNHGCYLDYRHIDDPEEIGRHWDWGIGTIFQAYTMEPVTPEMDETAASFVLGGQGNLWSEVIYAGKIAEYMIFPRICAIAEALWSDKQKDIEDFSKRLKTHQDRLDKLGLLQYRGAIK